MSFFASGNSLVPVVVALFASGLAAPVHAEVVPKGKVVAGAYDLVVTDVGPLQPGVQATGGEVTFTATIHNRGPGPTPSGVSHGVSFSVDGDVVSWSDDHVTGLAPGSSATVTANVSVSGTWTGKAGSHVLQAEVDPENLLKRENPSNNRLSVPLQVADVQPVSAVTARIGVDQAEFQQRSGFAKDVVVEWVAPPGQPVDTEYVVTEHSAREGFGAAVVVVTPVIHPATTGTRLEVTMSTGYYWARRFTGNTVNFSVQARAGTTRAESGRSNECAFSALTFEHVIYGDPLVYLPNVMSSLSCAGFDERVSYASPNPFS